MQGSLFLRSSLTSTTSSSNSITSLSATSPIDSAIAIANCSSSVNSDGRFLVDCGAGLESLYRLLKSEDVKNAVTLKNSVADQKKMQFRLPSEMNSVGEIALFHVLTRSPVSGSRMQMYGYDEKG